MDVDVVEIFTFNVNVIYNLHEHDMEDQLIKCVTDHVLILACM